MNAFRDSGYILQTASDTETFRTTYQFISLYLKHRGLYSAKFGYLGGIHLSLMLNRVMKLLQAMNDHIPDTIVTKLSPATIIRSFLNYYALFDWREDVVIDPFSSARSQRTFRDPVFIQAIHLPAARPNVASSCTRLSAQTLTNEFSLAATALAEGNWNWCLRPKKSTVRDFLGGFSSYVRMTLDIWEVDEIGGEQVREKIGCLESRVTRLMVSLGKLDGIYGRVWPGRFYSAHDESSSDAQTQYKGYYIVGLSAKEEIHIDKKILSGKLLNTVREFEKSIQSLREFQDGNVWFEAEIVPKRQITEMNLMLDERNWGKGIILKAPIEEMYDIGEQEVSNQEQRRSLPHHSGASKKSGSRYLRPAQDVIARIKWDPQLEINDFLIGYEDRFVGVKETPLGNWKSEQTDEEFIPLHRIVWIRMTGENGEKVWDRRKKIDLIFGSGNGH